MSFAIFPDYKNVSIDEIRKRKVMVLMYIVAVLIASIMGMVNLKYGHFAVAFFDFFFAVFLFMLMLWVRNKGDIKLCSRISIFAFGALVLFLQFNERTLYSGYLLWIVTFPLIAVFYRGKLEGLIISLIMLGVFVISIYHFNRTDFLTLISNKYMFRLVMVYFSILMFAYIFEYQRESAEKRLEELTRKQAMADFAIDTVHNAGNTLNSINTSCQLISQTVQSSGIKRFIKANELVKENIDNLQDFIHNNPKVESILRYYLAIEDLAKEEHHQITTHIDRIVYHTDHLIKTIAKHEKSIAKGSTIGFYYPPELLLQESLDNEEVYFKNNRVTISKSFNKVPKIKVQKPKLIETIQSLLKNTVGSTETAIEKESVIHLALDSDQDNVYIKIQSKNLELAEMNLEQIFAPGFSPDTDEEVLSFHDCANRITEMGGKLWIEKDNDQTQTSFFLSFPLESPTS